MRPNTVQNGHIGRNKGVPETPITLGSLSNSIKAVYLIANKNSQGHGDRVTDYNNRNRLWQDKTLAEKISSARVTIGGMGGLGWLVGGALSGLGVRNMQVFDPDHLEVENLNRLWGCQSTDLKQAKVDLFQQRAQGIDSGISVVGHQQAIPCKNFEQALIDSDVVFGCYDRPEPRLATQVLALKSNALYIDAGVAIKSKENGFLGFGQVFVSESIDVPCIVCAGLTQDTMGYRGDGQAPEPSSGVLNGVLANLAVSVWLQHLQGNDMSSMYSFDWNAMSLDKSKNIQKRPTCPICGPAPDWKDQV